MCRWMFAAALTLLALAGCRRTPDETLIMQEAAAMQAALQARQPRDFMEHVSADFIGNQGTVDREALHNLLRAQVLRNDKIGVLLGPTEVEVKGDRGTLKVTATFTGGSAGGLVPDQGSVYRIESSWKREGKNWRVYNATWKQTL